MNIFRTKFNISKRLLTQNLKDLPKFKLIPDLKVIQRDYQGFRVKTRVKSNVQYKYSEELPNSNATRKVLRQ